MKLQITERAREELIKVKGDKESLSIKVIIAGYGWGGPSFGVILEESAENDYVENQDGIIVSVEKEFIELFKSFIIDFRQTAFSKGFVARPAAGGSSC
jgi:Fe-S cluster assembly iron-binding protein IscA